MLEIQNTAGEMKRVVDCVLVDRTRLRKHSLSSWDISVETEKQREHRQNKKTEETQNRTEYPGCGTT